MRQRSIRRILTLAALAFLAATIALAESPVSPGTSDVTAGHAWRAAQAIGSSQNKLLVVTADQPDRRQACHVQSFTLDKLVCLRANGGAHTYLPQQIAGLIVPGDNALRNPWFLGFNAGLGASIWGTVVLTATCPVCAAGTALQALGFMGGALVALVCDTRPNQLLYLAPGWELSRKRGHKDRFQPIPPAVVETVATPSSDFH